MRLIIRPIVTPTQEIDVTQRVVATIAHEIWTRFGGCDALNWLEAERHVSALESHLAALIEQIRDDRNLGSVLPEIGDRTLGEKTANDIRQDLGFVENGHESRHDTESRQRSVERRKRKSTKRRRMTVSA